jgi:hypothetical protein
MGHFNKNRNNYKRDQLPPFLSRCRSITVFTKALQLDHILSHVNLNETYPPRFLNCRHVFDITYHFHELR